MKIKNVKLFATCVCACVLAMTGCGDREDAPSSDVSTTLAPKTWKVDEAPAGAVDVKEAKTIASAGDEIVIRGRIGGRAEPIGLESGLLVIMDPAVPSCADMPEDHCPTPWDYCCEPADSIKQNAATVQLRDSEGNPIQLAAGDLKPLDVVVVKGVVGPRDNGDTLLVKASEIFVEPKP